MARQTVSKDLRIHNKSDKPDNIVKKENDIYMECEGIQKELPSFLRPYFTYLKGNVLPMTRLAYLHDVRFFMNYLINETDLTKASFPKEITSDEFNEIEAADINLFIDYCRKYMVDNGDTITVFENSNRSLARKKSSLSVMFKQLYRDGIVDKNITDGFDPIRVSKPGEREIKALSELQQLNLSSFNFTRGEFKIYRKRGKESIMPLNQSVQMVLNDYITTERNTVIAEDSAAEDALFLSMRGKRITERAIRELVKKYTSIALNTNRRGGYSPHKLRATAATSLIGRGNSIYDVAALLDHEQVTTTQLYAQHKMNVKRDLVSGMEWELERTEDE